MVQGARAAPGRCRCEAPDFAYPGSAYVSLDLEQLGIVAPELLAGPVGEAGPLAQFDDLRCGRVQAAVCLRVGAQRIGKHQGIPPVVRRRRVVS